ncbi:hypothetical protein AB6D77_20950 [Vibrio splendidus]
MTSLIYLMVGRVWQVLISIVFTKIIVNTLSGNDLSTYYFVLSMVMLFGLFIAGPLGNYFTRNYLESNKDEILTFLVSSSMKALLLVFVLLCSYTVVKNDVDYFLLMIVSLDFIINTLLRSFLNILNLEGRQKKFVFYNNVPLTLAVVFTLFWSSIGFETDVVSLMLMTVIGKLIALVLLLFKDIKFNWVNTVASNKGFMSFCIPLSISAILVWLQGYSYRLVLEFNGLFLLIGTIGVLQTLASQFISNIQSIFIQYFNPKFFKFVSENNNYMQYWNKGLLIQLFLYSVVILSVYFFSDVILKSFLNDDFVDYKFVFVLLIITESIKSINNHVNLIYHTKRNTHMMVASSSIGLITPLLIFICSRTAVDVALILLSSSFVMLVVNVLLSKYFNGWNYRYDN